MEKKKIVVSIIGIVALLLIVIGVTYAAFNYTGVGNSVNRVTTGTVTMAYKEGNGHISITNAFPTSDTVGKTLTNTGAGDNNVFDFTVEVHITGSQAISYEVTAEKILTGENATTLNDNDVKLYLQRGTVNGTYSDEVLLPSNFNPLTAQDTFGATTNEMVLDSGVLNTTTTYYYRLRMWIDENCTLDGDVRKFSVKVNVYGKDGNIPSNNKVNIESVDRKTITSDDSVDLEIPSSNSTVTWTSSNTSIATVNSDGVVTPVTKGDVTITGTDGTITETITLTIESVFNGTGTIYRRGIENLSVGDSIIPQNLVEKWCLVDIYGTSCESGGLEYLYDTRELCEADNSSLIGDPAEAQYNYHCAQVPIALDGGIGSYTTNPSELNHHAYLKHDVVNYIVTKNYVCSSEFTPELCVEEVDSSNQLTYQQSIINTYGSGMCYYDYNNYQGLICVNNNDNDTYTYFNIDESPSLYYYAYACGLWNGGSSCYNY